MTTRKIERIFWVLIVGILCGINASILLHNEEREYRVIAPTNDNFSSSPTKKQVNPNEDFIKVPKNLLAYYRVFNTSLDYLRFNYIDSGKMNYKDMFLNAIEGLYKGTNDPYTTFLNPSFFRDISNDIEGEMGGIGLYLQEDAGRIKVFGTIVNTPSYKAGIRMGDILLKVNNKSVNDQDIDTVTQSIQGKVGTKVSLSIYRPSSQKILKLHLKRQNIKLSSTFGKIINKTVGYLKIIRFTDNSPQETSSILKKLLKRKVTSLIVDLRNNPGGSLQASVDIANMFIAKGLIVETRGPNPDNNSTFYANPKKVIVPKKIKMAVLVNGDSASAAEILSGTLKDHKRAIIVGEQTFGKGAVQSIFPLRFDDQEIGFKITVANYYTPGGYTISHKGITPNIKVSLPKIPISIQETIERLINSDLINKLLADKIKSPLSKKDYKQFKKELKEKQINLPDPFLKAILHEQKDRANGEMDVLNTSFDTQLKKALQILTK
jgi:carboxyl-terminal processing protease